MQLLPGQFVRVQVTAGQRDNVFLVPQTAVMQTEKGYLLFVLDKESKAAMRPVQTGDWVGSDWMILGGLNAGDRVIVDNLLKLRPGCPLPRRRRPLRNRLIEIRGCETGHRPARRRKARGPCRAAK